MSEVMIIALSILGLVIFVSILIITILKLEKKHARKILETISPIWVEYIDILIIKVSTGEDTITKYYPVFRNKRNNKVYIASQSTQGRYITPSIEGMFTENPKIYFKNIKKEIIEFNKEGKIYIEKETNTINVEDNNLIIEGIKVSYAGKYKKAIQMNNLYNLSNANILDIINGAIIFKGITDFDMEGILKEHIQ